MHSTERTRNIPIVFVSAAGRQLDYALKGYETRAVDFLHNPLDPDSIRGKVNVFVALDQQHRETQFQMTALERSQREQKLLLHELGDNPTRTAALLNMRDEFMPLVAHELRTPLNTLFLETQMRILHVKRGNMAALVLEKMSGC